MFMALWLGPESQQHDAEAVMTTRAPGASTGRNPARRVWTATTSAAKAMSRASLVKRCSFGVPTTELNTTTLTHLRWPSIWQKSLHQPATSPGCWKSTPCVVTEPAIPDSNSCLRSWFAATSEHTEARPPVLCAAAEPTRCTVDAPPAASVAATRRSTSPKSPTTTDVLPESSEEPLQADVLLEGYGTQMPRMSNKVRNTPSKESSVHSTLEATRLSTSMRKMLTTPRYKLYTTSVNASNIQENTVKLPPNNLRHTS
mmetsp:Transcript_1191/g.2608  ORF Transcript_1191/g.2608 Transcript_1191/m.2608 type:complete len:257 (+) Transcript_1191:592-1362(+)